MRRIGDLKLTQAQRAALAEAAVLLKQRFMVEDVILFGSVARGTAREDSDIDLLILTQDPPTHALRTAISDTLFELNQKHGTLLSAVVVERRSWLSGPHSLLPLHDEVERDGVRL
ncbi:MAG: nucleotidyltransferase domain-containing protein [Bacillota bacterium]